MHLTIEHRDGKYPTFTIHMASKAGAEPFASIRDCRIVDGSKGRFISPPAKKLDSGKYWNHVKLSDAFQAAVLAEYDKSAPAKPAKPQAALDDDIPF